MDAYQHFNLSRPPFDPAPDVTLYHDAPNHAEVLATLQYVVLSRKRCCVVIGESGLGKTLLARMVAQSTNRTAPVLWIHGGGQSDNETKVRVFHPRHFDRFDAEAGIEDTTLDGEMRITRFLPDPPLLIVDAAHELPDQGWRDVAAWLSNEVRYPKPVNVLLFGLPALLDTLARPEMECIRQRIFRVCRLEPLSKAETSKYVRSRVEHAGGSPDAVFTEEALVKIAEAARGCPSQINKLCDNAMLEAYSEERGGVTEEDVQKGLRTLFSACWFEQRNQDAAPIADLTPPEDVARRIQFEASLSELGVPTCLDAPSPLTGVLAPGEPLDDCLKRFKTRLSDAMKLVRQAGREDNALDAEYEPDESAALPQLSDLIVSWRRQNIALNQNNEALRSAFEERVLAESA